MKSFLVRKQEPVCMVNAIADDRVTQGARASASMALLQTVFPKYSGFITRSIKPGWAQTRSSFLKIPKKTPCISSHPAVFRTSCPALRQIGIRIYNENGKNILKYHSFVFVLWIRVGQVLTDSTSHWVTSLVLGQAYGLLNSSDATLKNMGK